MKTAIFSNLSSDLSTAAKSPVRSARSAGPTHRASRRSRASSSSKHDMVRIGQELLRSTRRGAADGWSARPARWRDTRRRWSGSRQLTLTALGSRCRDFTRITRAMGVVADDPVLVSRPTSYRLVRIVDVRHGVEKRPVRRLVFLRLAAVDTVRVRARRRHPIKIDLGLTGGIGNQRDGGGRLEKREALLFLSGPLLGVLLGLFLCRDLLGR